MRRRRVRKTRRGGSQTPSTIIARIVDQASTQVLNITIPPNATLITDQNTMSFMSGNLKTNAQMGGDQNGAGIFNALKRAISGENFFVNRVTNMSNEMAEITLSPTIPSAIVEIDILPGEEWKVYPGSMIAATSNVHVSGSINIFDNFKTSFVTDTAIYTTLVVKEGDTPGKIWLSGFGGIEKREIVPSSTPFVLNNGTFLAMPTKYWNKYVRVGTAGGILQSFTTSLGFVMKIQAPDAADQNPPKIPIYMQTLNIRNFQQMIKTIASTVVK
jgi:uncharacterized protein (AIM24 family)